MFLVERIFGIGIFMFLLILVCFLLVKTNITCKSILNLYIIFLCGMAFFYRPYITADLSRIFEQMGYFSELDFDLFFKNYVLESSVPVSRLIFYLFGKIGINGLLPMFSAFFCYSLIFYLIKKTKQQYDISNETVAIVLFFIMTTSMYISIVGGIRMMISLSMITFSYFRATVEKKISILEVLFFAASIFIHTMGFVVIGIVVLTLLLDSSRNKLKRIGYIIVVGIAGSFFVSIFSDTFQSIYKKFLEYVLGDKYSDRWEYIMGFFIILLLLTIFFEVRRVSISVDCGEVDKCTMAAKICILVAICFCYEFSMFYRFGGHLAVMFSIPTMMITIDKSKGRPIAFFKTIDLRTIVMLLSCVIAIISCSRGSLSSLKFFEL